MCNVLLRKQHQGILGHTDRATLGCSQVTVTALTWIKPLASLAVAHQQPPREAHSQDMEAASALASSYSQV